MKGTGATEAGRHEPGFKERYVCQMKAKDLSRGAPRSPRVRIRDYAVLARAIDKCRAQLAGAGMVGEYLFNCPLDGALFAFKGITADELSHVVELGMKDEQIGLWLDEHGVLKTPEEIIHWSDTMDAYSLMEDPARRDYFTRECQRLGLDPESATLFDMLDADDAASFPGHRVGIK